MSKTNTVQPDPLPGSFNERIARLALEFSEKTAEHRKKEAELKESTKELEALSKQICELAELSDLEPPYRVPLGTISVQNRWGAKVLDKELLKQSLESLDHGDIITVTVNAQTLGSLVRELIEENKVLPDGIEVTQYSKAVFTKAKAK